MSSERFYNRTYSLEVSDELSGWSRTYTNLDVKFRIRRYTMQTKYESRISILGLSREDINKLTTTATSMFSDALAMRKRVRLSAGYNGSNTLIYDGFIVNAVPTSPPEMWLDITAVNYMDVGGPLYDVSLDEDMTILEVFSFCANLLGLVPNSSMFTGANVKSGGFVATGGKSDVISKLNELSFGWKVYEDLGVLFATDMVIDEGAMSFSIDRSNGLLGVSNVTFYGADATTWLQDAPLFTRMFTLTSEMIPSANGTYNLIAREFVGHYRGREWYSKFMGMMKWQM